MTPPADVAVSLAADAPGVRLSGTVRLTLRVEGPAPVRAEPAAGLLDAASAGAWRVVPAGPAATADLPNGRQRWTREFVADPFVPGGAVPLGFGPVAVWAGNRPDPLSLTPEPLAVRVLTGVADVSAAAARPVTGVEDDPVPPPSPGVAGTAGPAAVVGVVVLGTVVLLARRRRRRPPPPADPLTGLAAAPDAEFAHRLSDWVRAELHTDALPARRLTTPELPPGPARDLLDRLDAVRFGGGTLTPPDRHAMLDAARGVGRCP